MELIGRFDWFGGWDGHVLVSLSFLLKLEVGKEAPDALFRDKVIVAITYMQISRMTSIILDGAFNHYL